MEQLKPLSLQQSAYREIKRRIVTAVFRPGEQINTGLICNQLQIGRTPVHLAIHRLEGEGLIEIMPRRGVVVKPIDRAEMLELIEARHMVEPEIAALAEFLAGMHDHCTRLYFISVSNKVHDQRIIREHEEIFAALVRRDSDAARAALRKHIESLRNNVHDLL